MNTHHWARAHPSWRTLMLTGLALGVGLIVPAIIAAQTRLSWTVIGSGSSDALANGHRCASTLGQPIIGDVSSAANQAYQGFWAPQVHATLNVGRDLSPTTHDFQFNSAPNPMSTSATVHWTLETPAWVRLNLVDMLGRTVATIFDGNQYAGTFSISWNGQNNAGVPIVTGNYLLILTVQERGGNDVVTERQTITILR